MREAAIKQVSRIVFFTIAFVVGVAYADIYQGLVGHWTFDEGEGATAQDTSGNGYHGTLFGGPRWIEGHVRGGLDLDGADDYVELPIGSLIGSLTDCTVATWANFSNEGGAWQRIFDFGTGTTANMFLTPRIGTAEPMRFAITIGGGGDPEQRATAASTLASGWHHVAVTIDADNDTITLYLDGAVVADNTAATLTPSDLGETTQNWLGRSQYAADAYFDGSLDDFRIYNRALSADDIVALTEWAGAANAGDDQRVEAGNTVTLNGSGPADATSFFWQQIIVGDEPTVSLADPNSAQTTFDAPSREIGYILSFRLTVVSPAEGTNTDDCLVYITAPNEPRLAPQNFRVYPANLGFRLEWDMLVDADEYGVGFKLGPGSYYWFWTKPTFYDLIGLTEGEATVVALRARNGYGQGAISEDITLVPMRNYALPTSQGGAAPPSGYVYTVSSGTINDAVIEDDNNDSWTGLVKSEDYWGYLWSSPIYFDHVTYYTGGMFWDGGWFLDLTVQYTEDGISWIDVPTTIFPEYNFADERAGRTNYERYDLSIPTVRGVGIRIYGTPGGAAAFTSISELEVFGDQVTVRPLVVQGLDGEVPERGTASLDGSWSFSTRGSVSGFTWEQVSGPTVAINNATTAVTSFDAPGVEQDTVLVFKLTATDGTETLSDEDVRITVRNLKTTAVAGPDQSVEEGSEASLNGIGSLTTSGSLTYEWTQTVGSPVTLINPNAAVCTFTAPVIWDYAEELTFQLRVDDGLGQPDSVSTDEVVVEVRNSLCWPAYPLPEGYFKELLHLGKFSADRILAPLNINSDPLEKFGGQAFVNPVPAEVYDFADSGVTVTRNLMIWTPIYDAIGRFGDDPLDEFEQIYHLYIISPETQDARFHFFHDDEIRIWNNGALVAWRDGWNDVTEQAEDFTLDGGLNSMTIKFEDGTGGNWIAVRITDRSDLPFDNLYYSLGPSFLLADAYAVRELPNSYQPGGQVQVSLSLRVNPDDTPTSVTISETLPAGLTVADAGGGMTIGGTLNWNLSGEEVETKVISYTLDVADAVSGSLNFPGTVSFAGTTEGIKGDRIVYEVPAAPQNLDVEMLLAGHLSWSASLQQGVVGYRVYSSVNGQAWQNIAYVSGTSYMDTSVASGSTYKYQVSAVNAGGAEGAASSSTDEKMIVMEVREAEDFNYGGGQYPWTSEVTVPAVEATAQDDLDAGNDFWHPNKGGPKDYRPLDNVGIWELSVYGVAERGVGWIRPGSWWRYTFDVPEPGPGDPEGGWVKLVFRVDWPWVTTFAAYWDETLLGTLTFTTGAWHVFTDLPLEQFQTTPGEHTLRVEARGDDPNVDVLDFDKIGIGFNWEPPKRQVIFEDDFEDYTTLYVPDDAVAAGWIVENGSGYPDARWRLWNTDSATTTWLGSEDPNIAGMTNNYMITDSDLAPDAAMDEGLITPELDCTNWIKLRLDFSKNFRVYAEDTEHLQVGEVDVRTYDEETSSWGEWVNLLHLDTTNVTDMNSIPEQLDLSAYDGKGIQIRWHFSQATYDYWFAVDDIVLSGEMKEIPRGDIRMIGLVEDRVQLTWDAFGGGNYTVEFTDDLASGDWQAVPGVSWPITETTWPGESTGTLPTRYYRVRSE